MNWNNVNLNSPHERGQNLIDPLSFETLLLEVNCNEREINEVALRRQFTADLESRIVESKEVFESNLKNLVEHAKQRRAEQ